MEGIYDATVAVIADEAVRAERAAARGHVGVDERAARQLPQEEKARRATYTVTQQRDDRGARKRAVRRAREFKQPMSARPITSAPPPRAARA